jgi:hypothetical protein
MSTQSRQQKAPDSRTDDRTQARVLQVPWQLSYQCYYTREDEEDPLLDVGELVSNPDKTKYVHVIHDEDNPIHSCTLQYGGVRYVTDVILRQVYS